MSYMKVLRSKDAEFAGKLKKVDRGYLTSSGKSSKCWEFQGTAFANGYGRVYKKDSSEVKAHRYSFLLTKGKIGKKNGKSLLVLHKCDNRPCCNPNHLYTSDHRRNMDDMIERNRQAKGEANARATKTEHDAAFIKMMVALNFPYRAIAEIMGSSKSTVAKFGPGCNSWAHVSPMNMDVDTIQRYFKQRAAQGQRLFKTQVSAAGTSSSNRHTTVAVIRAFVEIAGQIKTADALNSSRKKLRALLEHTDTTEVEVSISTGDFRVFSGQKTVTPAVVLKLLQASKYTR